MLNVRQFPVGPYEANAYLVWDDGPGGALLVDAGAEPEFLLAEIDRLGRTLEAILQTHAHGDHIGALEEVVEATGAPVYLHPEAEPMLQDAEVNLSAFAGIPVVATVETRPIEDGDELVLLERTVEVLHTPGHAPGSVSFHFEADGVVFTGDALFSGSVGRTDFPGGSMETLIEGIRDKLLTLPDETVVYSGHLGPTTIGRERETNPFLRGAGP